MTEAVDGWLDPETLTFHEANGRLHMTIARNCSWLSVSVRRLRPLSDTDHLWSVCDCGGKEVGIIESPGTIEPESLKIVTAALNRRYFLPKVVKVNSAKDDFGTLVWNVETDSGPAVFMVRNLKDNITELGASRVLLTDVDGFRYEFPDIRKLDAKSMDLLLRSQ